MSSPRAPLSPGAPAAPSADTLVVDIGGVDGSPDALQAPDLRASRRRRRLLAAGAVLLVALAAGAVVVLGSHSSPRANGGTGVLPGETTTTVTRRTLSESSTIDGTLGYGTTLELYNRLSGTYTWLPAVGAVIGRGGTLFRVNNLPVALMYGSVPAYRTMKVGVGDGPDVAELNRNLIDLGFDPYGAITDVEAFGEATAAAVRRWQKAEGLPETGRVELGRIDFAPGARRVTAVKVLLGQDPPGEASKEPAASKAAEKAAKEKAAAKAAAEKAVNEKAKEKAKKTPAEGKAKETPAKEAPAKEAPARETPAKESPAKGEGEPTAGAGAAALTTTSTQQIVQLKVKAEQQQLAHVGESAPVTLPGGNVVRGRIVEVGLVASQSKEGEKEKSPSGGSGEGESPTISVTLALDHRVAHLDQAPVSVELVKSIRHDVLAVPATALTATAGGGYAIETLQAGRRVALAVTPGMFAGGYVEIEGPDVRAGMTVIESQ